MQTKKADLVILATAKAKAGKEAELESALRECAGPTREQMAGILAAPPDIVAFDAIDE